jgi:predicted XRE-type DNA-binding protein
MTKTNAKDLAKELNLPASRAVEAIVKAELISAVIKEVKRQKLTHAELARRAKLARSTVTGILGGSLRKVTIDRILRLVDAAGLEAHVKVRRAA